MRRIGVLSLCLWLTCAAPGNAIALDFRALRDLIEQRGIGSVDALIEALPEDLRRHYALVFASRSLQSATPASPRAILFGTDAMLVLTFNGTAAQRGYGSVETMAFDPLSNAFEFREIQFSGGSAAISAPNPARCVACHGSPARPIWDAPPAWPGVYGERYGSGLSSSEAKGMHEFLAKQPLDPRYRHLLDATAFGQRATYVTDGRIAYDGVWTKPPNALLSELLTTLNTRAILSELAREPGATAHRYVLLAAAQNDCGPLPEFYPRQLRAVVASDLSEFAAAGTATRRLARALKASRLASGRGGRAVVSKQDLSELRFVAERQLGIDTARWTLALERDAVDLIAPEGSVSLADALFAWVSGTDARLAALQSYRGFSVDDTYCAYLRRSSVAALEGWYASHRLGGELREGVRSATRRPDLLDACIACHTGEIGPALPFAESERLAPRLLAGDYPRGRLLDEILYRLGPTAGADSMPRGMTLDAAQRRRLEEYFLALAARRQPTPD